MYTQNVTRINPSCILFLIDQSGSMSEIYPEVSQSKADVLAMLINKFLRELTLMCFKSEGIKDYFYVGVVGYGNNGVGSVFLGNLAGNDLVSISKIADNPIRIEEISKKVSGGFDGSIEINERFPIWFDSVANGQTPMITAFRKANQIIENWLEKHPNCFPPMVINITDGENNEEGNLLEEMEKLKDKSSSDGNVLLFNLHINTNNLSQILFPDSKSNLQFNQFAEILFEGASFLPDSKRNIIEELVKGVHKNYESSPKTKTFVMNASLESIIKIIDIGTLISIELK